jgi:hypothetical protein
LKIKHQKEDWVSLKIIIPQLKTEVIN